MYKARRRQRRRKRSYKKRKKPPQFISRVKQRTVKGMFTSYKSNLKSPSDFRNQYFCRNFFLPPSPLRWNSYCSSFLKLVINWVYLKRKILGKDFLHWTKILNLYCHCILNITYFLEYCLWKQWIGKPSMVSVDKSCDCSHLYGNLWHLLVNLFSWNESVRCRRIKNVEGNLNTVRLFFPLRIPQDKYLVSHLLLQIVILFLNY